MINYLYTGGDRLMFASSVMSRTRRSRYSGVPCLMRHDFIAVGNQRHYYGEAPEGLFVRRVALPDPVKMRSHH